MKLRNLYLFLLGVLLLAGCSKNNETVVTEVVLNYTTLNLNKGETKQLMISTIPENRGHKDVRWSSNNISIATVSDMGLVTAIKGGEAIITAMLDGKSTTCVVTVNKTVDIYVVGSEREKGATISDVAKVWKNGIAVALPYGQIAKSIYVLDDDVYVVGHGRNAAMLWKNDVLTSLTDGTSTSFAQSVFVSDGDVYVAGSTPNMNSEFHSRRATIWKNRSPIFITGSTSEANSVYVSGNDVYIAGAEAGLDHFYHAKIWKNGVVTTLTDETHSSHANSVYVSGNNVYVAGWESINEPASNKTYDVAKLWINGTSVFLTDGSHTSSRAYSVYVSDGNIYVAGHEWNGTNKVAKVWKNGVAISLTDGKHGAGAHSIFVSDGDVYVAGYESNGICTVAKVWKNNIATSLTDGTCFASAYGIFVVER